MRLRDKHLRWLSKELPELVNQGVLDSSTSDKLLKYYGFHEAQSKRNLLLTIFSFIGAMLIGLGIMLLLAHNWDNFSRLVRTLISLAPLLASQLFAAWIIYTGRNSNSWRESVGVFYVCSIGSSIALIGQIYHVTSSAADFLLSWMLLVLPLVYLLKAGVAGVFYLLGLSFWTFCAEGERQNVVLYWVWLSLMSPYLWHLFKINRYRAQLTILNWALALSLTLSLGVILEDVLANGWMILYSALFSIFYMIHQFYFDNAVSSWQRPYRLFGTRGIIILSFIFSYEDVWNQVNRDFVHKFTTVSPFIMMPKLMVFLCILILWGYLFIQLLKRKESFRVLFVSLPIAASLSHVITFWSGPIIPLILFNMLLLIFGVCITLLGIRKEQLDLLNEGLLILLVLILLRFFDVDLGLMMRGIIFIILGAVFLGANWFVIKRRQKRQNA